MNDCDFCKVKLSKTGKLKQGKFLFFNNDMSIAIHQDSNEMLVETDTFDFAIKINYCPICGKRMI